VPSRDEVALASVHQKEAMHCTMKRLTAYVDRNASVITGKANLEPLYTLHDMPVFVGCVDTDPAEDLFADMEWGIDPETGVVQLRKLIPLEILYQAQHAEGCGPTWQRYYEDFASYIIDNKPESVLEIGGGQGTLATLVTERLPQTTWTIVEPNPLHPGSDRIKVVRGFFDEDFHLDRPVDTIVTSQVLEHIYDPQSFLHNISRFLNPGQQMIFAYPNLKQMLERQYTNALNFEHTIFLTDYLVDHLLPKHGFAIRDKVFYKEQNVFYATERVAGKLPVPALENKYNEYKNIFLNFINYHTDTVQELNRYVAGTDSPVYLFGAHIFSQYLLGFGLQSECIVSILDNGALKQGKRLYGTGLKVESPKVLRDIKNATVILKAGMYNQEIKEDIVKNINDRVVFLE
jgi:2-polyprenyl-3-methyl-5-hydroxy-6-metoxy-1,4-benzoquinol methylase